jgi:hypothetical protein
METVVTLPNGTQAALVRTMDYGDVIVILLLVAIVFLQLYSLWRQH